MVINMYVCANSISENHNDSICLRFASIFSQAHVYFRRFDTSQILAVLIMTFGLKYMVQELSLKYSFSVTESVMLKTY